MGVRLLALLSLTSLMACATEPKVFYSNPGDSDASNAHPYSYDYFMVDRPMPTRPANDFQFYYKHCQEMDKPHYTGHSYTCTTSPF